MEDGRAPRPPNGSGISDIGSREFRCLASNAHGPLGIAGEPGDVAPEWRSVLEQSASLMVRLHLGARPCGSAIDAIDAIDAGAANWNGG